VTPVKKNNSPELPVADLITHYWLQPGTLRGTRTATEQSHEISRHPGMKMEIFMPGNLVATDG
jgi:hypothetical protein